VGPTCPERAELPKTGPFSGPRLHICADLTDMGAGMATGAEIGYNANASALAMANEIFGSGVTVNSATYSGPTNSSAIYSNGNLTGGVAPSNNGVILSTGNVQSFTQSNGDPNRSGGTSTNTNNSTDNNAAFNSLTGGTSYDAVWLDVNFTPTGNTMKMTFVFASEEYPEYINSSFNDAVGVWINGTLVPVTVGNGKVSVNNVNGSTQESLFINNTNDAYNTEMDGFTAKLTLTIPVNAGVPNTIRIGIADGGDSGWDSNLLIARDSVQTALVARDDTVTVNPDGSKTFDVLSNDSAGPGATLVVTHINGQPVTAGSTVTLPSGQQVTLNANGTMTVAGDGQIETKNFTYTISDGLGNSDIGMVTLTSVPCFVAGTRILTPSGEVPVETLCPGDLVMTMDEGAQPLRWIGQRTVPALGKFAPIRIRAGTFGDHAALMLSPQHRVLVRDSLAELLFGEFEVLVAAKDLVNDRSIRVIEGGEVTYVHLLFDRHQIVYSEGLATESFLPGSEMAKSFDDEAVAEIYNLFPELDPEFAGGLGHEGEELKDLSGQVAARRVLRSYESKVLFAPARRVA
jgi:hypothetical protein